MTRLWRTSLRRDELLLLVLATVAATALWGSAPTWWLLALGAFGVAVAAVAVVVADRLRLLATERIALAIGAFVVGGGIVSGPVPLPGAYLDFFRGLVAGWADLLTSIPPVALDPQLRALPYLGGWLAAVSALVVVRALRSWRWLAVLPPLMVFALGLLFGAESGQVALIQGTVLVAVALIAGSSLARPDQSEGLDDSIGTGTAAMARSRLASAGIVVVLVAVAGAASVAFVPGFDDRERFDLRSRLEPPWEPLEEPSPLAQLKANFGEGNQDTVVFTATGDDLPRRWTLATLGHFDGQVWTVGSAEIGGRAEFVAVDASLPQTGQGTETVLEGEATSRVDVTMTDAALGPWLPTAGRPVRLVGDEESLAVRADRRGRTLATPAGAAGQSYAFDTVSLATPSDAELTDATLVPASSPALELASAAVVNQAAAWLEGVDQGWPQVSTIAEELQSRGFYQADDRALPGHSWPRLESFAGEEAGLRGNEEQFAALAAVLTRSADLPVRVVVGYILDPDQPTSGEVAVTRNEAAAWIEVETQEYGWVPVDVTPDRDKEPTTQDPGVNTRFVAAPNPPPPPPERDRLEPDREEDELEEEELEVEEEEEEAEPVPVSRAVLVGTTAVGVPLAVLALWVLAMVAVKAAMRRRRRRRGTPRARIAGAWREVEDRLDEVGIRATSGMTPHEQAAALESTVEEAEALNPLADSVAYAAYSGDELDDADAVDAWDLADQVGREVRTSHGLPRRLAHRAHPGPVVRRLVRR